MAGLIPHTFKLRPDRYITLLLPSDLTRDDVKRIIEILKKLVVPN